MSSAPTTEVETEPKESTEVQGGSWWPWRTKTKKASAKKTGPAQRRRKLTCPSCGVSLCVHDCLSASVCVRTCMRACMNVYREVHRAVFS